MADSVLVLGAAGFIGRHVCLRLAKEGFRVHGMGHGPADPAHGSQWGMARWTAADITLANLRDAMGDEVPLAIIHCAGSGAVAHSYAHPLDDFNRTVATTAAVLDYARLCGRPELRVVLASSAAVYGDQGDVDLSESAARAPVSPYGFHKVAAETLCDSYARFFGVQVSVVRLFSVYGDGLCKQLLWDAANKLIRGDARFFGTGNEVRDWIHIDDAATLLASVAVVPSGHYEVYNGGHVHASTREVLSTLSSELGLQLAPSFSGEVHSGNPRRLTADCRHTQRQLGWSPKVKLAEGLHRYAQWFLHTRRGAA